MLKRLEISGFKSFTKKTVLDFSSKVTAIVGPNGSGKSNVVEAFQFALGEQSMKSMRGKRSEDLIFSGTQTSPRANRAAVSIVFDNSHHLFPLNFDEVVTSRAVFRDGTSEYRINDSKARLRDIQELLARANFGESDHHIISQGEADRILRSSPCARREILEDALGLKAYEFKKKDAIRKLEKTQENITQVQALRRELTPHLHFLEKQIEKLERVKELKDTLSAAAKKYFSIEDLYLATEKVKVTNEKEAATKRCAEATEQLAALDAHIESNTEGAARMQTVHRAEVALEKAMSVRAALSREIGRVEGALGEAGKRVSAVAEDPYAKVPRADIAALRDEVERQTSGTMDEPRALSAALTAIRTAVGAFFERFAVSKDDYLSDEIQTMHVLEEKKKTLSKKDDECAYDVEKMRNALVRAREAANAHEEAGKEGQRRVMSFAEAKAREGAAVVRLASRLLEIAHSGESCEHEKQEVAILAGPAALSYESCTVLPEESRTEQERRRYELERLKIRLEESGGTGEDIRHEFEDVSKREQFLTRELADLTQSAESLEILITDLEAELTKNFAEGLASVNTFFEEFFSLMFGGGGARLVLEESTFTSSDEDDEGDKKNEENITSSKEQLGIEVVVHLPKKRVQSLVQLSGGERALTSIALIFAMSQVNPPPFLILDETDAALDEANSRRYGDMIETLSKRSQLIVITHNRETMSRASIIYGVTMGTDGISKLLSVKFEEAVAVAK